MTDNKGNEMWQKPKNYMYVDLDAIPSKPWLSSEMMLALHERGMQRLKRNLASIRAQYPLTPDEAYETTTGYYAPRWSYNHIKPGVFYAI